MRFFYLISVLISLQLVLLLASPISDYDSYSIAAIEEIEDELDDINYPWSELVAYEYEYFKSKYDEGYYSLASNSESEEDFQEDEFKISAKWTLRSMRLVFPEKFSEVNMRAAVFLFYGFDKDHRLYSIAKNYIHICYKIGYSNFDPNSIYSFYVHNSFERMGFDLCSLYFKEFCEHVFYHEMPKTSPLYKGNMVISFRKKWILQREALLYLASSEIIDVFNRINLNQFKNELNLDATYEDNEIVELVINMLTSKVPEFLSSAVNQDGDFTKKLEFFIWNTIVDACEQCKVEDPAVPIKIEEILIVDLLPTFELIYNYNDPRKIDQHADLNYSYFS